MIKSRMKPFTSSVFKSAIAALGCGSFGVMAQTITVNRLREVQAKVCAVLNDKCTDLNPDDILVAFDIDMTLTWPVHAAVAYPNLIKHGKIYKEITAKLTGEQKDFLATLLTQNLPQATVEEDTCKVVSELKAMKVRCIAFTATLTGPYTFDGHTGERFEKLRFDKLNELNLNFEGGFKEGDLSLDELPRYNGHHPVFYHGILLANGEKGTGKGAVLSAFLHKTSYTPKVVIVVDDKKKNLEDVERALKASHPDIPFIGVEYTGAMTLCNHEDISEQAFQEFWQARVNEATSRKFST